MFVKDNIPVNDFDLFDSISSLRLRLDLLSALLASRGNNLVPVSISRPEFDAEIVDLVADELARLSLYLQTFGHIREGGVENVE